MSQQSRALGVLSYSNFLLLVAFAATLLTLSSQPHASLHAQQIDQNQSAIAAQQDMPGSVGRIFMVTDAQGQVTFTDTPVKEHVNVQPGRKQLERRNPKFCDAMTFFSQVHCRGKRAAPSLAPASAE